MEIEWRHLVPGGNAGIFVWADDITARGVPFHRGIEVQVLENSYGNTQSHTTHGDIFPIHGADMTPIHGRGGKRAFPTEMRSLPSPEWNHYRIVCNAGSISLAVNGEVVTRGEAANPSKGYICLESEGGVVEYRNARIRELPDTPIDPEHIATADRGFRSLYSGLDLRDWTTDDATQWQADDWILRHLGTDNQEPANPEQPEPAALKTNLVQSPQGIIFDFRIDDPQTQVMVHLPGWDRALQLPNSRDDRFPANPPAIVVGSWNRIEIRNDPSTVAMHINGEAMYFSTPLSSGEFALSATGPVEFANIYVRP